MSPILISVQLYKSLVYNKVADIYLDLNNPSQAIMALVKAVKVEHSLEKNEEASQRLALIYSKIGKSCFYSCNYEMSYRYLLQAK